MAKCEICGKKPMSGNNVSFAEKDQASIQAQHSARNFYEDGRMVRKHVCTRCLRTSVKKYRRLVVTFVFEMR